MKTTKHARGWLLTAPGDEYLTLFRPDGILARIEPAEILDGVDIRECREGARIFIPNALEDALRIAEPAHVSDLAMIRSIVEALPAGLPVTPGVSANPPN